MSSLQNSTISPAISWKLRLYISAANVVMKACRRSNYTLNRRLFSLLDRKSSPSNKPINGVTTSDVTVDASRSLWFRLYTPTTATTCDDNIRLPVIVFFHGGGFAFFNADSKFFDDICRRLSRELSAVIVSVDYCLSPEHKCPKQYEDGFEVLKFLDSESFERFCPPGADLKNCFISGDSAGANLAHNVALVASDYNFRILKLAGVISIQPFFGGEERTESELRLAEYPVIPLELHDWMWKAFLPAGSDRDHPAANVFGPNSVDISKLKYPATIVFVGGFDPLQDWQRRYYLGLKKHGKQVYLIEYPNAFHGFYSNPELPDSSLLVKDIRDFMRAQSAK